jgi:hypothetical protein
MHDKTRPFREILSGISDFPRIAWLYATSLSLLLTSCFLLRPMRGHIVMLLDTEELSQLFTCVSGCDASFVSVIGVYTASSSVTLLRNEFE